MHSKDMKFKYNSQQNKVILKVRDYTRTPGGRYRNDGGGSTGEEFLEEVLKPAYEEARKRKVRLLIDLDGVIGYPPSFVSGSFGRLSLELSSSENLIDILEFKSEDIPRRIEVIKQEIRNPRKREN